MTLDLNEILQGQVFAFLLIFARIGAMLMLFPGIGEPFVRPRTRLMFALGICFLLLPILGPGMPAPPAQITETLRLLVIEILIGIFFGTLLRIMMSALEGAGTVISLQTGLSNAMMFNPAFATQGTLSAALLGMAGILLLFATGLEATLLRGMVGTYTLFEPGANVMMGDMTQTVIKFVSRSFALGVEMAAPFVIIVTLFFVALGIMARMQPNIQVLLVALPMQIMAGLALLGTTVSAVLLYWLTSFEESLHNIILQ